MDFPMCGSEFGRKLIKAWVDMPEKVTRNGIDIPVDDPVKIYYETLASKKTADVVIEQLMKNKDIIQVEEVG